MQGEELIGVGRSGSGQSGGEEGEEREDRDEHCEGRLERVREWCRRVESALGGVEVERAGEWDSSKTLNECGQRPALKREEARGETSRRRRGGGRRGRRKRAGEERMKRV